MELVCKRMDQLLRLLASLVEFATAVRDHAYWSLYIMWVIYGCPSWRSVLIFIGVSFGGSVVSGAVYGLYRLFSESDASIRLRLASITAEEC